MNEVLQLIHQHRSIRKFKNIPLTAEQIEAIVDAAQMAPTSAHMQPFSIIGVTDHELRKKIAVHSENPSIEECGYFFIFCADLHRMMLAAGPEQQEKMSRNLSFSYFYQTAVLSAALALQNANLAAESMGLGVVIIGGINSALPSLDEWLDLPDFVIPLVGFAVGVPDEHPEQKPRLPRFAVFFENRYDRDLKEQVESYDRDLEAYYGARTNNKQKASWSGKFIAMLDKDLPLEGYTEYVKSKGFDLK
ncbi:NADPH-dependent oxidoreductase [Paenibacillus doosanensis]|uniref:NADPH-dependent oxidoreductase n=1 Tax=Paenibacillus doosanensis TaxID=1229154 RepID=UPI0021807CC7|nr:NADPH-dependent oxidoreductase [Paenibacillus doosanensis]MCS7461278.1 NADPH-dependent oxidoreductase [Paenibacillus doosanensis]